METGFTIAGEVCPYVDPFSMTMGELCVLYDLSGVRVEDIQRRGDETDDERHVRLTEITTRPSYKLGLFYVAYARRHPELPRAAVIEVVENVDQWEAFTTLVEGDEDENPPNGSGQKTASEPTASLTSSGTVSSERSGQQEPTREATGVR